MAILVGPPTIDVSPLVKHGSSQEARQPVIKQIGDACAQWGFFQTLNHGIPNEYMDEFSTKAREFFALPEEQKKEIERTPDNPMGFFNKEFTKNTVDVKEVFDMCAESDSEISGKNQWPREPVGFKKVVEEYFDRLYNIAQVLTAAISESLGLDPDRLNTFFGPKHTSLLRLNYYPKCPDSARYGVNRHTDPGAVTILMQDFYGPASLQVRRGDQWYNIQPVPYAYVINIGDMMQVWSNDRYVAPEHRVITNSDKERLSIPFFYGPAFRSDVEPLVGGTPVYRTINYGEFIKKRFNDNYANLGEEVQITQYRLVPPLTN